MKLRWAWILGFVGIVGSICLVVKEHLAMEHSSAIEWLMPTFKYFNYPGFLAAPWIVEHFPFIVRGDLAPNMTEVRICDAAYILISGIEWFVIGAIIVFVIRKVGGSSTSSRIAE
jgi:hypothetical protein